MAINPLRHNGIAYAKLETNPRELDITPKNNGTKILKIRFPNEILCAIVDFLDDKGKNALRTTGKKANTLILAFEERKNSDYFKNIQKAKTGILEKAQLQVQKQQAEAAAQKKAKCQSIARVVTWVTMPIILVFLIVFLIASLPISCVGLICCNEERMNRCGALFAPSVLVVNTFCSVHHLAVNGDRDMYYQNGDRCSDSNADCCCCLDGYDV